MLSLAVEMEPIYHLPSSISGTMKELLADPPQTTRSLRSAQAVMRNVYAITKVDDVSRRIMSQREVRTRMGLVLDIFKPKSSNDLSPNVISKQAEQTASNMIKTAAVIYNRGLSDLGPIELR